MTTTILLSIVVLIIAITMSMVGKGGGNFYVIAMVLAGTSMTTAATTSQLIMIGTSVASMLIFHKNKKIDWKLALVIDPPTDIMAFVGGYFAGHIPTQSLKLIFALSLIVISVVMMIPVREKENKEVHKFGYWNRKFGDYNYTVNLWITLPLTAMVGFFAGAVGISGGAFKIPLMVMLCGIPMEIAVGTSSAMVAVTALSGFAGHLTHGHFDPVFAIPLMAMAVIGGVLGGKYAVKSRPKNLKMIFAVTNLAAAIIMLVNLYL